MAKDFNRIKKRNQNVAITLFWVMSACVVVILFWILGFIIVKGIGV